MQKTLIVMAGLPGSGKSTVAEGLSRRLSLPILSIDPVEAAMWRSAIPQDMTGIAAYVVVQAIAEEQLKLGHSVIIDAVNPVDAARQMWRSLAGEQRARLFFIECVCADREEHRRRIESRVRGIPGMPEVTWDFVEHRRQEYEPWQDDRLMLDTSGTADDLLAQALAYVNG